MVIRRAWMTAIAILAAFQILLAVATHAASPLTTGEFRDCPDCPVMVTIPAVEYEVLGSGGAPYQLKLKKFAVGKFEVTVGEFAQFVRATKRKPDGHCSLRSSDGGGGDIAPSDWVHYLPGTTLKSPVTCVSLEDALAYVAWLSERSGRTYSLPDFDHWTAAARAGRRQPFAWDDLSEACALANVFDADGYASMKAVFDQFKAENPLLTWTPCSDGFPDLAPVGSKQPNKYGVFDLVGNAEEYILKPSPQYVVTAGGSSGSLATELYRFDISRPIDAFADGDVRKDRNGATGFRVYIIPAQ